jgi:type II secretory pathway predicted ATPase ExeA
MYEDSFRFCCRPFPSAPAADFYFPASTIENAHQTLARCIERAEGPGLLVGGSGTGKSLLCQMLARRFRDRFHVATLDRGPIASRRALLQTILFELELPFRGLDETELQLSLVSFLDPRQSSREGLLLMVDEAQTLSVSLIEDIRVLTNLAWHGQSRVRALLTGTAELEETLANPKLESLNQRIAARCYLQPLTYDETLEYVRSQIAKAGGQPHQVIATDALQAVYHASGGIPRLVNQICNHALILAASSHRGQVDVALVEEAWADLQQLPMPVASRARPAASEGTVIEFGALDDSPVASEAEESATDVPLTMPDSTDLPSRLDEIEHQLSRVEDEDDVPGDAIQQPTEPSDAPAEDADTCPSEPRLAFDPFAESFDEEESVVDHYAALESASRRRPTPVSTPAEREFDTAVETILRHPRKASEPVPAPAAETVAVATAPVSDLPAAAEAVLQAFSPESHDAEAAPESEEEPDEEPGDLEPVTAGVVRSLPADDNDLIVVMDDEIDFDRLDSLTPRTHRREYRDLFTKLRES